jgi:hypothetical protein
MLSTIQRIKKNHQYKVIVALRVLVEAVLNLVGFLNITPLFVAAKTKKKRIAFQAYSIHLAQFYQTIIPRLLEDSERIEVIFIIVPHPHFSHGSRVELREFIHSTLRVPPKNIKSYWQTIWWKFDILVCTDVYAKFPLRKVKKILLKHGPGVSSRIVTRHPFRKTILDFDLTLVNGNYDLNLIKNFFASGTVTSKLISIGFPYLDRFEHLSMTRQMYHKKLSLDSNKKTVLFAPSWRGLTLILKEREDFFDQVISILKELNINIVIKLHACSFNKFMVEGMDWHYKLSKLSIHSGVHIDYDIDDIPALMFSDILITDISSRAFNFMLLDKPVIQLVPFNVFTDQLDEERIKLIQQCSFIATEPGDIKDIFNRFNDRTSMGAKRLQVSKQCFANQSNATEAFVNLIQKEVELLVE